MKILLYFKIPVYLYIFNLFLIHIPACWYIHKNFSYSRIKNNCILFLFFHFGEDSDLCTLVYQSVEKSKIYVCSYTYFILNSNIGTLVYLFQFNHPKTQNTCTPIYLFHFEVKYLHTGIFISVAVEKKPVNNSYGVKQWCP